MPSLPLGQKQLNKEKRELIPNTISTPVLFEKIDLQTFHYFISPIAFPISSLIHIDCSEISVGQNAPP